MKMYRIEMVSRYGNPSWWWRCLDTPGSNVYAKSPDDDGTLLTKDQADAALLRISHTPSMKTRRPIVQELEVQPKEE